MTHEYAFDVTLVATVRVVAETKALAREAMGEVLDACDVTQDFLSGYNGEKKAQGATVRVTEASLGYDPSEALLFEVDGEDV